MFYIKNYTLYQVISHFELLSENNGPPSLDSIRSTFYPFTGWIGQSLRGHQPTSKNEDPSEKDVSFHDARLVKGSNTRQQQRVNRKFKHNEFLLKSRIYFLKNQSVATSSI